MAGTTPSQGIPYAERPDPFELTADLRGSFNKIDSVFAQTRGESTLALSQSDQAIVKAAQALARALAIEDPIHVGPSEPTEGEELWVDTDDDSSGGTGGGAVSSQDITDATDVGRAVLTAPLSLDARNALSIFTGTRALLDAGTDTAERTWDAKELSEYVTATAENAGGAASWDDLTGKPSTFPPAVHNHDDRYYTEAEVDAKIAEAVAGLAEFDTGWQPLPLLDTWATSGTLKARRIGNIVWLHFDEVQCVDNPSGSFVQWDDVLPSGFRPGEGYVYLPLAERGSNYSAGPIRVSKYGQITCYNNDGDLIVAHVSFVAETTRPTEES